MCVVSGKPSVSLLLALAPHPAQPRAQPPRPAPAWRPAAPPRSPGCGRPTRTHLSSGRAWSSKHINASCQGCREHARVTTHVSRGERTCRQWRPPPAGELGGELYEPHACPGQQEQSSGTAAPRHSISWIKVPKIITGITYFNCHYLPTWFVDHFVDRTVSSSSNLSEVFQVLCSEIPVLLRGDLQFSWRLNAVGSQSLSVKILGSNFSTF